MMSDTVGSAGVLPAGIDDSIFRFGFWMVVVTCVSGVIAPFFPTSAPGGYDTGHAESVLWLSEHGGAFIAAWSTQIVGMLSLSGIFMVLAWQVLRECPLRAVAAAMAVLVATIAFIIPKFMAIWAVPQMADAVINAEATADMADSLLLMLNVSIPFSLFKSLDYLGFWMYALCALLLALPLVNQAGIDLSTKITGVAMAVYGLAFHALILFWILGAIPAAQMRTIGAPVFGVMLIAVVAAAFNFRKRIEQLTTHNQESTN
ncbi:hypothetical protein [Litorivivens sp.]|uniref:hypothetical protein n=1 Tax=Litorivivens sp. TaxID=2020868 RepID=UPI00356B4411